MRTPTDVPRRKRPGRTRVGLIGAGALLFLGLTSLRGIAGFYTTYLWFDELRLTSVWSGVLGTKIVLAAVFSAVFFGLLLLNLVIAEHLAPRFRALGPEDEIVVRYRQAVGPHAGKVRIVVALLLALLAGTGASSQWNSWLLYRNGGEFGVKDPQFGRDVGFFVFELPFLSFVVNWAFVTVVIIAVITVVAHYLNGGIRVQSPGQRVAPNVKAHISVLLGALALIKAVGYYLQRYELSFSSRGVVNGATYTDVKAQLPALELLIFISLAAFVIFLANIRRQGWVLPIIGVGLWAFISVIVGAVYPAFTQKFRVEPSEVQRETPYIARNIKATRAALGFDKIQRPQHFDYAEDLTATDLAENAEAVRNVRLWDPVFVQQTYQRLQEIRQYYRFTDVDVDRYVIDGKPTQTIVSARELNPDDLPSQSWVNKYLQFTHGYGALLSPANAVTADGKPEFLVKDIPPVGTPKITEPRIYFGEKIGSYAIVRTKQKEIDFQSPTGQTQESTYQGQGGVPMSSFVRRVAFSLRFGDINPLISGLVTPSSRAIFLRDIGERVRTAAPFLRYDADPYPVIVDGRISWIQDAYTTTDRYPNAQRANTEELPDGSGLRTSLNYVRNSVKVVIDAYDGSMRFYVVDPDDPIAATYARAFPELFSPASEIPPELRQHFRYPEDLFRVQTNTYGRYHITEPVEFYRAADAWNVSQDPGSGRSGDQAQTVTAIDPQGRIVSTRAARIQPTYLLMRLPGDEKESFLLLRPFVAASAGDKQQNLTAFMTAKSDPENYGTLQVFEMPRGEQIDGPALIDSRINANSTISKELSLLDTRGSQVLKGNVLVLPIENSILYIRPLYVQSEDRKTALPELKKVIVVYGNQSVEMGDTLQEALTKLFGAAPPTLEQPKGTPPAAPGAAPTAPGTEGPALGTAARQLLDRAQAAFDSAQAALRAGDLAEYQRQIGIVGDLVRQARESPQPAAAGDQPPPPPTTAPGQSAA